MPDQEQYLKEKKYGGTIRLGAWPCKLMEGSLLQKAYSEYGPEYIHDGIVFERHRHRYEFNNDFKDILQKQGLIISGTSPDGKLVEAIELPKSMHPFFVATQYHPEYKSRFLRPNPVFVSFIKAASLKKQSDQK
jgi:CTP synthase